MLCLTKKCCPRQDAQGRADDGEWIQPVKVKTRRDASVVGSSSAAGGGRRRASVKWETLRDSVLSEEEDRKPSIQWADVIENLSVMDDGTSVTTFTAATAASTVAEVAMDLGNARPGGREDVGAPSMESTTTFSEAEDAVGRESGGFRKGHRQGGNGAIGSAEGDKGDINKRGPADRSKSRRATSEVDGAGVGKGADRNWSKSRRATGEVGGVGKGDINKRGAADWRKSRRATSEVSGPPRPPKGWSGHKTMSNFKKRLTLDEGASPPHIFSAPEPKDSFQKKRTALLTLQEDPMIDGEVGGGGVGKGAGRNWSKSRRATGEVGGKGDANKRSAADWRKSRRATSEVSGPPRPPKGWSARKTMSNFKKRLTLEEGASPPHIPSASELKDSFQKKRMALLTLQEDPTIDVASMKKLFRRPTSRGARAKSSREGPTRRLPAVTSIAVLSDGYFLAASRAGDGAIGMHRTIDDDDNTGGGGVGGGGRVELVARFEGHRSGVAALAVLDRKGRFLSAGMDKTVKLWDSRYDVEEDSDVEGSAGREPTILLATFDCFERLIHSIEVLTEGSYVRPTDDVDMAMVAAMAKKTALEGAAAVQQAALRREIIECSGSFATLSRNDKKINMWDMSVADGGVDTSSDENAAQIKLVHRLEHETSIGAMAGRKNLVIAGDIMGVVIMWKRARRASFASWGGIGRGDAGRKWTKTHRFAPWKAGSSLRSPEEYAGQSVARLCLLNGTGTFVSASKDGTVRVWDGVDAIEEYEVHRGRHAHSVRVTSESVTGVRQLPHVRDPNTGEECLAFSVGCTDGHVMSLALYPRNPSSEGANDELVMFHVHDNSLDDVDSEGATAIESIAVSGTVSDPVVVTGDCDGGIKTVKPTWKSVAIS